MLVVICFLAKRKVTEPYIPHPNGNNYLSKVSISRNSWN